MISNEENIIIKSISKSLNTEIKFLTLALTLGKSNKDTKSIEEKPIVILLGKERLFILLEDFKKIKLDFEYDVITKLYKDKQNSNALLICLDKNKLRGLKLDAFHIFLKNRSLFIKSLICYHSIYNMEKYGIMTELVIKEKCFFMENKEESLLSKGLEMTHNHPEGFKKVSRNGADFFLKDCVVEEKDNVYYLKTHKGDKHFTTTLSIEFGEILLVEKFETNKDEKDIYYYASLHFLNYMRFIEKNNKFWITKSEYYNKKFNLNIDKAKWEGFRIELRTASYLNPFENKLVGTNENFVFLYLRRKFIPPFYDSYLDISIILKEPYENDNYELSYDSELLIETIADSMHFPQKTMSSNEYENILEGKLEALLLGQDSLEFFYNNLKITGKDCYKCVLDYLYHLLTTLETHDKENIESIKDAFLEKLKKINLCMDPSFDSVDHDKYIRNNDIDTIIRDFETKINTMSSNEYYNQVKNIWEEKLWRYIVFCVDGGLTNDRFNLEKLISIYKKVLSIMGSNSFIYHIQIQVNNMLNVRIYNHKDQPLDPKISSIINQINEVKTFTYNEKVMNLMIKTGVLKSIQGIENDGNYANFIKFMLDNNPTVEFLKALVYYLQEISVDFDLSSVEQSVRKSLNSILSSLVNIYANSRQCPITLILACKCLTILTCSDIDKNNKTKILQDNILEHISNYLDYQDEKLLFCSLKLLLNILPDLKENIAEILYKNSKLIPKLINVLSGTGVPQTFHSLKTVESVVKVLINLLKMQPNVVREKLCSDKPNEKNRVFVGYLIKYIMEEDSIGDKTANLLIPLQRYIFEFFIDIIKKNNEMKMYMQDTFNCVDLLQELAQRNFNFLKDVINDPEKTQLIYGDMIEPILKKLEFMLKFAFFFLCDDKAMIALFKKQNETSINYFVEFINLGYNNVSKDLVSKISLPLNSINSQLNSQDEDE